MLRAVVLALGLGKETDLEDLAFIAAVESARF